jgi:chemotaxis protein methyltransferase CheR
MEAARRELLRARLLLEEEDAARLAMFGGGFTRGALVALCETDEGAPS